MIRRIFGVIMLLIGLSGIGASYVGARIGYVAVDAVGQDLVSSLGLLSDSLQRVEESLILAKSTVAEVNQGLDTVEGTAVQVSRTISETQPLLNQLGHIASEEVPDSLEAIEESLPGVSQVAGVIDDTLTTLSDFRIDESILGFEIKYDLGIDYNPAIPFDDSVDRIGVSLSDLPDRFRDLKGQVAVTSDNLHALSQDMDMMAQDLDSINQRIREVDPLLSEYLRIVVDINDRARVTQAGIEGQLDDVRKVITFLMVWMALAQIAPLYIGWELLMGRRMR